MVENTRQRRVAAMRTSERMLSGSRLPTMREQLAVLAERAELDGLPDFYGDGPVAVLEERVAELLGTEAAVFFPTGTMAQQVALRYGAERSGNPTVALHPLGHQEQHELRAYADLSGLRSVWPTTALRNPTAEEIAAIGEPVSSVVIELPLRDAGFVLPTWDELVAVAKASRDIGARLHLDGARIWDSTPYLEHSLSEIAGLADSVYVSFYKTLGGLSGAALAGTGELASYARAWRHRHGGLVFQQWPAALMALAGLENELPRVPELAWHARTVAAALAALPGVRVHPEVPHTHDFQLWLPHPAKVLGDTVLELAEETGTWFVSGWQDAGPPGWAVAEVRVNAPALDWTAEDVTEFGTKFLDRAAELSKRQAE
ncbi:threonine aldolase [Solihabitans fulvus]|uniref:Threonine aldolase n=1 Tax=Solihabitans fulvus TaxID=1892852 RepID=A0A5B2WE48_9PSEU|nr:beta-eliminating lyase-related protein [Solihabitans fulvus]KAA2250141.1 threonine aldolase [Solihabitans fulvus]